MVQLHIGTDVINQWAYWEFEEYVKLLNEKNKKDKEQQEKQEKEQQKLQHSYKPPTYQQPRMPNFGKFR